MWLDREAELRALAKTAESGKAEFMLLYGRRRVGKSDLLDRFISKKGGVRLLARQEAEHLQLRHFSELLAEHFKDKVLASNPFTKWDAFFTYLNEKAKGKRLVVALDEFPYLVEANPSLPSLVQYHWDQTLRKSRIFLILCGSSIGMMESLMGARSPLYGRRTGQVLLHPLRFIDALPRLGEIKTAVQAYAVFGGTPAYLLAHDPKKSLYHSIKTKVLNPEGFLFRDVEFILRQEVREPRAYFSILESIAKGNTRVGQIINDTGLDKGTVGKYVGILIDLRLVEREVPVSEKHPAKSRKGIYRLSDQFIRFWFRFVYPNLQMVEQGRQEWLLGKAIMPYLGEFTGPVFEGIAREILDEMDKAGRLPLRLIKLGRWWEKNVEIDLVGIGECANLFCEVKWSDKVDSSRILPALREKAQLTGLKGEQHFCVVARSFAKRAPGALHLDLKDIQGILASPRKQSATR